MSKDENLFLNRGEWFRLEAEEIVNISELITRYGDSAPKIIDNVLHREGAVEIRKEITRLLPASGRKWRKKARPASAAMPGAFDQDDDPLSVVIAARGRYSYLYFPDDGSNTKRHVGNQEFMRRGAEAAAAKIIDICLGRLAEAFGG